MIVLFSLIMAVGMVVDNAIVIVENIYRHYQLILAAEPQLPRRVQRIRAAMSGTAEVAWPVITSTLTTVAAFAPMIFWPGIMGGFMKYLPITLIITLLASLFVALVINPVLSSIFVTRQKSDIQRSAFMRGYRRFLQAALEHRYTTLGLSVALLVGLGMLYAKQGHGVELFPSFDPRRAIVDIRFPQGTNIRETDRLARVIEQRLQPFAGELERVITNVGAGGGGDPHLSSGGGGAEHLANITLAFHDYEVRQRPSADVVADIRRALADLAGAEIKVDKEEQGPPMGAPVTVRLIGEDFKVLEQISAQARQRIGNIPGLVNLRSDHEATRPELAFRVDRRRAMLLGVNTAIVGNFLKTAVFGSEVGKYRQFNDEYDITVRLPAAQRENVDDLFRLRVPNSRGESVPLSSLGDFTYTGGYGTIQRINQKRVVTLTADAEGRLDTEVLADVQQRLKALDLPLGYEVRYAGQNEEMQKAIAFLSKAFIVALLLIVLILVAQFNRLTIPIVIMTTVILSLIGVFAGLLTCRMPFGVIMTGIGVISLAGVVVNNAIVLLDYTRILRERGMDLVAASVEAGATRLRPVLLTAGTTVLGLVPMALGISYDFHKMTWALKSESSQWWASMSVAVIFGLTFATLLTLVVVPALYVTLMRLTQWLRVRLLGLPAA
jgi:multidrug efflux pump subunit AcrB